MVFPGTFVGVESDGATAAELSLEMVDNLQETLKQRKRQLEDIVARQKSLAQEYEQLNATATGLAQQFSGIMTNLETDSSAPVDLGDAGLGKDHKAKRWKASAILVGKGFKTRDVEAA